MLLLLVPRCPNSAREHLGGQQRQPAFQDPTSEPQTVRHHSGRHRRGSIPQTDLPARLCHLLAASER